MNPNNNQVDPQRTECVYQASDVTFPSPHGAGVPGSDYINSNYIDGYRRQNAYIATQGPLPETFGEFWRMVWEQHTANIIMMTKLEEKSRVRKYAGAAPTQHRRPQGGQGETATVASSRQYLYAAREAEPYLFGPSFLEAWARQQAA